MAPVSAFAWRRRADFGTFLIRFLPPREPHLWPQWVRSHGGAAPIVSSCVFSSLPLVFSSLDSSSVPPPFFLLVLARLWLGLLLS